MRAEADLARDALGGLYRGARGFWKLHDPRETVRDMLGGGSDPDHYDREETVADYTSKRRAHVDDHRGGLVARAERGELSGKQYITAKEMRQADRYFERQGIDMSGEAPLAGRTVVDATGGDGWMARYLAGNGADVLLGDRSRPMVRAAREQDPEYDVQPELADPAVTVNPLDVDAPGTISYMQSDATRLPLPDDTADDAFLWRSLHTIGDLEAPLKEMARVVKPGGRVMADTFSARSGRRLYTEAMERVMGMESTLHTGEDVVDAVIGSRGGGNGLYIRNHDSLFVMPYGAFRGLDAGDPATADTVRWNEEMEETRPGYGSVDFWTFAVKDR